MRMLHVKKPLTEKDLDQVEAELGVRFPKRFREFYLLHNGGMPERRYFPFGGDYYSINEIYPIKYGKNGLTLESTYQLFADDDDFPTGWVPFASDGGGDLYCICVTPDDFGRVYFYSMEWLDDPERERFRLADDFGAFVDALISHIPE